MLGYDCYVLTVKIRLSLYNCALLDFKNLQNFEIAITLKNQIYENVSKQKISDDYYSFNTR